MHLLQLLEFGQLQRFQSEAFLGLNLRHVEYLAIRTFVKFALSVIFLVAEHLIDEKHLFVHAELKYNNTYQPL
jgi:hypothetical protein